MMLLNVVVAVRMDDVSSESAPEDDGDSMANVFKRIEEQLIQLTRDVTGLRRNADEARSKTEATYTVPIQKEVKSLYENETAQHIIAGTIMLNFAFSILQGDIDPFSAVESIIK